MPAKARIPIVIGAVLIAFLAAFGIGKATGGGGEKSSSNAGRVDKVDVSKGGLDVANLDTGGLPGLKKKKPAGGGGGGGSSSGGSSAGGRTRGATARGTSGGGVSRGSQRGSQRWAVRGYS